jgi:hypothetical protein
MPSLMPSRSEARALESEIAAIVHPPVAEAREALAYWRERASRLPWYRWEARREARVMASRWRERLLRARLERWGLRALAPAMVPLSRGRGDLARALARRLLRPAGLARRAAVLATAVLLGMLAATALVVVLAVHVAAHVV